MNSSDELSKEQELQILVNEIIRQLANTDTDGDYAIYHKAETFDSIYKLLNDYYTIKILNKEAKS